jgi:predicted TIM-barrel fold metal-dependent hydrolase
VKHGDLDIIDADGHVYERDVELYEYLPAPYAGRRTVLGFALWPSADGFQRGAIHARLGIHETFAIDAGAWLVFLDGAGIGTTVLYPTLGLANGLVRDRDWAVALARAYNDWLADRYLRTSPRLLGVAVLPLQDPTEAAAELRRAVGELGMVGGVLPATGLARPFGDRAYDPVYAAAEALDCPLAIHGGPSTGLGLEDLDRFAQVHTLSHPFAQMRQVTSVVMSGVLDRFPRLRIAFLEAGIGWVPFLAERMDRAYTVRKLPEYVGDVRRTPSSYLTGGNVFFSPDPSERGLAYAAGVIGGDGLLFASDFPHEVNLERCREELAALAAHPDLPEATRRGVLGANARRFYALDTAVAARRRPGAAGA